MNDHLQIGSQGLQPYLLERITAITQDISSGRHVLHVAPLDGRYRQVAQHQVHRKPELFLQISGATHFHVPAGTFTLRAGEHCLMPDGVPHFETIERDQGRYANIVIMFPDWGVRYHLAVPSAHNRPQIGINRSCKTPHSGRLVAYLEGLTLDHCKELPIGPDGRSALLHVFFSSLASVIADSASAAMDIDNRRVDRCLQLINSQLDRSDLTVRQLAGELHCNADYLSALFKREIGESLLQYIHRCRIEHAKVLLWKTSMTASEICYTIGYRNPSYFNRVFRKYTSQTPGGFRTRGALQE